MVFFLSKETLCRADKQELAWLTIDMCWEYVLKYLFVPKGSKNKMANQEQVLEFLICCEIPGKVLAL